MAPPPKWNVMIFLAGNNSLSEECRVDFLPVFTNQTWSIAGSFS